jgi:hypothetical protein
MTMDENAAGTLLRKLADTEAPPARVDLRLAMVSGRRRRRIRLAGAGGSVLAIGAVIGVVVTMVVTASPGAAVPLRAPAATAHASVQPVTPGTSAPDDVPRQFNPLIPYASFGWLPKGYTTVINDYASTSTNSTALAANSSARSAAQGSFWLHVMATGACTDRSAVVNCHWDSGDVTGPLSLRQRAPDVNGRPAYWTDGDSILWEYAPGAWATMVGPGGYESVRSPAVRALILKVAAGVRYDGQASLVFPLWLSGIPASWQLEGANFTDSPPALDAAGLDFGPAVKPEAAMISVTPSSGTPACLFIKGESRYVTVDGVKAILQGANSSYAQALCVSNLNGQHISVQLSMRIAGTGAAVPGAAAIGGALGLFRHLHLLGTDPAGWTTDPFR